ncbi:hypothetical protein [Streptomyces adonidis]|uniref:hypothetical protein n=1 Tax=Streptomyces adonidis TaxID=3231367 RepID=UPI0034DAF8E2
MRRHQRPDPQQTTNLDNATPARLRLDRALDDLPVVFRGTTARADEVQCECHWGSAEELALLKVPDVELGPDLLYRTWHAFDWEDHGAVLRRILPQFARALAGGLVEPYLIDEVGRSFSQGDWHRWPVRQSTAVEEFLHAWWAHSLTDPDPVVPVHGSTPPEAPAAEAEAATEAAAAPPPLDLDEADPQAVVILASLRIVDRRLILSRSEVAELAPAVGEWLAQGLRPEEITGALTTGLPTHFRSRPARVLAFRLREAPLPAPQSALPPVTPLPPLTLPWQTCDGCERAFRAAEPCLCRGCEPAAAC